MINPYILLVIVFAIAGAGAGGFWFGMDYTNGKYAALENERKAGWADALDATARELAKIKVTQRNVTNQAETIIKEKTIYAECKHTPEMVELLNQAAKGGK